MTDKSPTATSAVRRLKIPYADSLLLSVLLGSVVTSCIGTGIF